MSYKKYPLVVNTWGEEEQEAAIRVIRSGKITMGALVNELEKRFALRLGVRYAVMVNSGSSANLVAVGALFYQGRFRPGDEVVVPAVAWATTYAPFQQYGLRLRVVDVTVGGGLGIDVSECEAALTATTRAVVGVNILGNPCDLDRLRRLCDVRGLTLFEDNCESLGATVAGRPCGAWGDVATHSFFFSHHISTGEGGMITTDDRELADLCRCLRAHGWARDLEPDSCLHKPPDPEFGEAYQFLLPGYNVRPTEIAAAVGVVQLHRLDAMLAARRQNARVARARLGAHLIYNARADAELSWFAFPLLLDRRAVLLGELRAAGVEVRPITGGNFLQHPACRHYQYTVSGEIRVARRIHNQGIFIGNHAYDLTPQLDTVAGILKSHDLQDQQ